MQRFAFLPSINFCTSSAFVESPHISRCLPSSQMSFDSTNGGSSDALSTSKSSSFASSSVANRSAISFSSKPVSSKSKPNSCNSDISTESSSSSHPASNAMRLSASTYAFFWASVRWSTYTQGTSEIPSSLAAISLPCPARTL